MQSFQSGEQVVWLGVRLGSSNDIFKGREHIHCCASPQPCPQNTHLAPATRLVLASPMFVVSAIPFGIAQIIRRPHHPRRPMPLGPFESHRILLQAIKVAPTTALLTRMSSQPLGWWWLLLIRSRSEEAVHGCDYQHCTTESFGFVDSKTESEAPCMTIKQESTTRRMRNGEVSLSSRTKKVMGKI